jgi:Spy/CpxP family protein refolding chaperone
MMIFSTTRQRIFTGLGSLALLATLGFAPAADAAPGAQGEGKRGGKKIERICKKLECDDAQEAELRSVFKELRTDTKSDREGIRDARKTIAAEFAKERPNEASMKRAYQSIDAHEDNIRDRTHDALMEAHGVLNPEQRKTFAKMAARLGKGHGRHGGKGKGKGKGEGKGKAGKAGKRGGAR